MKTEARHQLHKWKVPFTLYPALRHFNYPVHVHVQQG